MSYQRVSQEVLQLSVGQNHNAFFRYDTTCFARLLRYLQRSNSHPTEMVESPIISPKQVQDNSNSSSTAAAAAAVATAINNCYHDIDGIPKTSNRVRLELRRTSRF